MVMSNEREFTASKNDNVSRVQMCLGQMRIPFDDVEDTESKQEKSHGGGMVVIYSV